MRREPLPTGLIGAKGRIAASLTNVRMSERPTVARRIDTASLTTWRDGANIGGVCWNHMVAVVLLTVWGMELGTGLCPQVAVGVCGIGMGILGVGGAKTRAPLHDNVSFRPMRQRIPLDAVKYGQCRHRREPPRARGTACPPADFWERAGRRLPSTRRSDGGTISLRHSGPSGAAHLRGCTSPTWGLVEGRSCCLPLRVHLLRCMPAPTTPSRSPAPRQFEGEQIRLGSASHLGSLPTRGA